jgi:small subunit ribosomal protein S6
MQKYEVLAIIVNSLDEKKALDQAKKSISDHVKSLGGVITFEDFWGQRGFAYIIKGQKWGYYFCAQFDLDPAIVTELKRDWNIDKSIVRFLIEKVDPKAPAPRPYEETKKEFEALDKERKIVEMNKSPKKKEARTEERKEAPRKETLEKKAPVAVPSEPKKTATPKDIVDKKLDEILSDSSLDL